MGRHSYRFFLRAASYRVRGPLQLGRVRKKQAEKRDRPLRLRTGSLRLRSFLAQPAKTRRPPATKAQSMLDRSARLDYAVPAFAGDWLSRLPLRICVRRYIPTPNR